MRVAKFPDNLTTLGLGSCVGITLYDKANKIGGLSHIMLPSSKGYDTSNRAKFADLAIGDLLNLMLKAGANRAQLTAKIAGGAHMFGGSQSDVLMVGERNVAAVLDSLRSLGLHIAANDTGGTRGRTIVLYTDSGSLRVKSVGAGEKII